MYIPVQKRDYDDTITSKISLNLLGLLALLLALPVFFVYYFWKRIVKARWNKRHRREFPPLPSLGGPIGPISGPIGPISGPTQQETQTDTVTSVPEPAAPFPPERNEYTDPITDPPPLYTSRKGTMLDLDGSPDSLAPAHLK